MCNFFLSVLCFTTPQIAFERYETCTKNQSDNCIDLDENEGSKRKEFDAKKRLISKKIGVWRWSI